MFGNRQKSADDGKQKNSLSRKNKSTSTTSDDSSISASEDVKKRNNNSNSSVEKTMKQRKRGRCRPSLGCFSRLVTFLLKLNGFLALILVSWVAGQVFPATDVADYLVFATSVGVELFNDLTQPRDNPWITSWPAGNHPLDAFGSKDVHKRIGQKLFEAGRRPKSPVIFIPGIISTGLEVWKSHPCANHSFRRRFWTSASMFKAIALSPVCWLNHILLNYTTWQDPDNVKLRASSGLQAADYFLGELRSYWIWGRLIENLADIGYDESLLHMASYDWRMAPQLLEERDNYFTLLMLRIETFKKMTGERSVLVAHSMGGSMVHYFLNFVEQKQLGWVERHIESVLTVGSSALGTPKSYAAQMSMETLELATILNQVSYVRQLKEYFVDNGRFAAALRSFGSLPMLLPKGNGLLFDSGVDGVDFLVKFAEEPDDDDDDNLNNTTNTTVEACKHTHRILYPDGGAYDHALASDVWLSRKQAKKALREARIKHGNNTNAIASQLFNDVAPIREKLINKYYYLGIDLTSANKDDKRRWHNPLASGLPYAPTTTFVCAYGTSLDTERAYYYKQTAKSSSSEDCSASPFIVDYEQEGGGFVVGDGDGTVPLISLGYMCQGGWRNRASLNPANARIITLEFPKNESDHTSSPQYAHTADVTNLFRGTSSSDHVDIMGNEALIADILNIATGASDQVKDRVHSNIVELSKKLDKKLDEMQK